MENEQVKTIEGLQFAIQMEIDGKKYYQKASQESNNKVGRELFEWLAGEEDKHRQRFEQIYTAIKNREAWPDIEIKPGKGVRLQTLFSQAMDPADRSVKAAPGELDSIAKAMEMENKTRDFYESQSKNAVYDAERKFYEALASEERGHYMALVDYREYLIDPVGYFTKTEHHSLDGG